MYVLDDAALGDLPGAAELRIEVFDVEGEISSARAAVSYRSLQSARSRRT
ncbi:hypothetical protein ACWEPL_61215 [Nonomuraea sp. NPDC004186]